MPWEKQFDVEATLEKAMAVFWRQGYGATTMQDLVARIGLNPGSIYATYGNKRSLFIQALRHYQAGLSARFAACEAEMSPREAILAVFEQVLDEAMGDAERRGCLMVNTALEVAPHDDEIAGIVSAGFDETRRFFHRMIRKGQTGGSAAGGEFPPDMASDMPPDMNAEEAARVLLGLLCGMRALSRGGPERSALRAIARHARVVLQ